ncbi:MAG: ATP-binding protein [Parachlamydiales bacterium]|nr:ATP-binding protein [Parachlamydiales bacterium]
MIITVAGGKGGTGKSMVATSLALEYAKQRKIFLADADVECPNDHLLLGIKTKRIQTIFQPIPKWNVASCTRCGKCASVCKQNAIAFTSGKSPVFLADLCIGCKACLVACPLGAISEGKKAIGTISRGENHKVHLISGELKLGQPASGEIVTALRKYAETVCQQERAEGLIIDAAAGVGCPVIASLTGSDYVLAVTEPTPSALHDLKRVLYLAEKFRIPTGIVINKYDLDTAFCNRIMRFAQRKKLKVLQKIPYSKNFVEAALKMKPVVQLFPEYTVLFTHILQTIQPYWK